MRGLLAAVAVAALLPVAGCSEGQPSEPAGVGDLTPIEVAATQSGYTVVGVIHAQDPGAPVFNEIGGITIGSIPEGDFDVYDARKGWYMVAVDTCEGVVFGWVPPAAVTFTLSNG